MHYQYDKKLGQFHVSSVTQLLWWLIIIIILLSGLVGPRVFQLAVKLSKFFA